MKTPNELVTELSRLDPREGKRIVGASASQLERLSAHLGFPLPTDLFAWLSACNGFRVNNWALVGTERWRGGPSIYDLMGKSWPNPNSIPVATDDYGNLYCLLLEFEHGTEHLVGYVEAASADQVEYVVRSSLLLFVEAFVHCMEVEDDSIFLDEEKSLSHDPTLRSLAGIPLPWE